MKAIGSGLCLTSASITALSYGGGTAFIPGVTSGDPVILGGNTVTLYADRPVGVFAQLASPAPILDTSEWTLTPVNPQAYVLLFSSPDEMSASIQQGPPLPKSGDTFSMEMTSNGFAHTATMTTARMATPSIDVDDVVLEALPAACNTHQTTRVRAISSGIDITRLVVFRVSDESVLELDTTTQPGVAHVRGLKAGRSSVYIRDLNYVSAVITVSNDVVAAANLRASVVTGVQWGFAPFADRPLVATAEQRFDSEASVGWLYVFASFDDGTIAPVTSGVTSHLPEVYNQTLAVMSGAAPYTVPPLVSVVVGASSMPAYVEAHTCLGVATAIVNITLPPPTAISLTSAGGNTLVPEANGASYFRDRSSSSQLQALVTFADGTTRDMSTDQRVTFSLSKDACGGFSLSGSYRQLTIFSACRTSDLLLSVTLNLGGHAVSTSQMMTIEWLSNLEIQLRYADGVTPYTDAELRQRFECSGVTFGSPMFHTLTIVVVGTLSSGASQVMDDGLSFSVSGATLKLDGEHQTVHVDSPGPAIIVVRPSGDVSVVAEASVTAITEVDSYTFEWDVGLVSSTVRTVYGGAHSTTARLRYASGYVETISDADRAGLITFESSDEATLAISATGELQPTQNSMDLQSVRALATFCDGQSVTQGAIYANLVPAAPFDYDIGGAYGLMVEDEVTTMPSVCIPLTLYSTAVVDQFQFVLRFDSDLLACSSTSCGTWTPGASWSAFGASVGISTDSGQVDFATVASVKSLNRKGALDVGTLCLDVIGAGDLLLQIQSKVHIDASGTHNCDSGTHLYRDGLRCYSRTPEVRFAVGAASRARQLGPSRGLQGTISTRARPMNIDSNVEQLTMADCLLLGVTQQQYAGYPTQTQAFIDGLGSSDEAASYNPNLDFYRDTDTPVIDPADLTYCINYVMKRWRFVDDVSLGCSAGGPQVELHLAGGKVGSADQAEFYVEAPCVQVRRTRSASPLARYWPGT